MQALNTYLTNEQIQFLIDDKQIDNGNLLVLDKIEAKTRNYYLLENNTIVSAPFFTYPYASVTDNGGKTLDGEPFSWEKIKENPDVEFF